MLSLLLATTFLFTCEQAQGVIDNVYQNEYVPEEVQQDIINSVLEVHHQIYSISIINE